MTSVKKSPKHIRSSETNSKVSRPNGIKQLLKLLETGDLSLNDIEIMQKEVLHNPQLGDVIQYELQKHCQKTDINSNVDVVVKLSKLCYSEISVLQFTNMDRFIGCVYYITSYLLKKEKYKEALDVVASLKLKKSEILNASKSRVEILRYLSNVHSILVSRTVSLLPKVQELNECYALCHELALASLEIFLLTSVEQPENGKKVLRTSKYYLHSIKHFKDENILEYHTMLQRVLKILLPKMKPEDYCLYYLHRLHLHNANQLELYNIMKKTIQFLSIFLNLSSDVENSLNYILDYFFANNLGKVHLKPEHFKVLNNSEHSVLCFILTSVIFHHGVQFLWKMCEDDWSNVSSFVVKQWFDNMVLLYKSHYNDVELYCATERNPYETCFGDLITGTFKNIQYTIRSCLKGKTENALSLIKTTCEAYQLSLECLEYMKMRGCSKEQRNTLWISTVIHHTNTVEDIYKCSPSDETYSLIKDCAQEILKEIVNSEMSLPFDFRRVSILFQRWQMACIKLKKFNDGLLVPICYFVSYPEQEKEIMGMWLHAKSESGAEAAQEVTMIEMLMKHEEMVKEFKKTLDLAELNQQNILTMEMKLYSTCSSDVFQNPSTPYTLALRLFKQLEKCKPDIWDTSFAMSCLISANHSGENNKISKNLLEKFKKVKNDLLNWKRKDRAQCRSLLHAANLSFALFLYNVKVAEKSEGQMDSTEMVMDYLRKAQEEKVKFGEDADMNLICNIIPSSSHLSVELETNYLNELNEVVDLWHSALKNGFEELPTSTEFELWLQNVHQVALWYELIGEYQKSFTNWLMYYRIGKLCNDSAAILLGLSHLIKHCSDVDESGLKEEAELLSGQLGVDQKDKEVLVEYCLAIAGNYMRNKKFDKCLEYLTIAKKFMGGLTITVKTYGLRGRFWCLVSQFLSMNKDSTAVFDYLPGTDLRVMAFKAFSFANMGGRSEMISTATQSDCTELVLTMVEVNTWAFYLHGVYRQADFMKFFLDDLYRIVQKLFLPTRTAEMLVRLAEVDIICEKMSDCQEKVNKLKSILTTLNSSERIKQEKTPPRFPIPQTELEIPSPRPISPARFLDKPFGDRRNFDLSPTNYDLANVKPKTSEHDRKCKCRLCQNLLIQTLTMNTIWLEAEMNNFENRSKEAAKCYSRAYEVLNKLEHIRAEQSKMLRFELASVMKQVPGELDFQLAPVLFHWARFLIRYALFESSSLQTVTDNVAKAVVKVSRFMKKFSYEEKLLCWTFMELKLFCAEVQKKPTQKKNTPVVIEKQPEGTKTPFVTGTSAQPLLRRNRMRNLNKSPVCVQNSLEDSPREDQLNTAFVTIKKAPPERMYSFKPRKLNVEESEDVAEEQKEKRPAGKKTSKKAAATTNKRGK